MNGKAIYMPKGKAGEYARYACNFYVGCSNDCDYCYCKRGLLGHSMGKPQATLKKCFKDKEDAIAVFTKELYENIDELRQHGLFFTFTSDPCLDETRGLTFLAVEIATQHSVPCMILTKRADFASSIPVWWTYDSKQPLIAFGFTLTGHDELERGASTNGERIEAMRKLSCEGFKTFASIEPIIDLKSSTDMISRTLGICDVYKIGLVSGKRNYTKEDVRRFVDGVNNYLSCHVPTPKVYWKDSVLEYINLDRSELRGDICIDSDYNLFNH